MPRARKFWSGLFSRSVATQASLVVMRRRYPVISSFKICIQLFVQVYTSFTKVPPHLITPLPHPDSNSPAPQKPPPTPNPPHYTPTTP